MNRILSSALLLGLAVASSACAADPKPKAEPVKPAAVAKLGAFERADEFAVACLGWTEPKALVGEEGRRLVAEVVVVNCEKGMRRLSGRQFALTADDGRLYFGRVTDVSPNGGRYADELAAGERLRLSVEFRVPKKATGVRFLFASRGVMLPGESEYLPLMTPVDPSRAGVFGPVAAVADIGILGYDLLAGLANGLKALDKAFRPGEDKPPQFVATDLKGAAKVAAAPAKRDEEAGAPADAGKAATVDGVTLTAKALKAAVTRRGGPVKAEKGCKVLQLTLAVDNTAADEYSMTDLDVCLLLADGRRVGPAEGYAPLLKDAGPKAVPAGKKAEVTLAFEVPADAADLAFRFHPRGSRSDPQRVAVKLEK